MWTQREKVRKKYETYLTPCQKLLVIPDVKRYLPPGGSKESLRQDELRLSHLVAAQQVQVEKSKLFNVIVR